MSQPEELLMIVDPLTREAYTEGDTAEDSGPLFFTTREALEAYARDEAIEDYQVITVPAGILPRMRGRTYWLDGVRAQTSRAPCGSSPARPRRGPPRAD